MKFTRNRRNRRNRRHTRKGGAPKTMDNNFSNCQNYWSDYNSNKCLRPWNKSDTNIRPFDIIDYPGIQNKIMGKKPTWLPETSRGIKRNILYKNDIKVIEERAKLNGSMIPYAEVPKDLYI